MTNETPPFNESSEQAAALAGDALAIQHLRSDVRSGRNWYLALLEAIRMWRSPEECYKEEQFKYLLGGQAFDWLRLAERLCDEIREYIPEAELVNLLFFDRPPIEISETEFKEALGPAKYRAYLNYLYGVLIEQALLLAAVYELRKGRISPLNPEDEIEQAYRKIYRAGQAELLDTFEKEMKYPRRVSLTLTEMKEFTYWLFQYRIKISEKPRVASDTKKALALMYRKMSPRSS